MTLDEIKQELQELTKVRRAGTADELMSALRVAANKLPRMTEAELDQRLKSLEAQLGDWWVIWDNVNRSYGIIPQS
jgi:hypothetical protein